MNSLIFYSLFLFFPGLLVCASTIVLKTPYHFNYNVDDVLRMDINMINLPPNMDSYAVHSGQNYKLYDKSNLSDWNKYHVKINGKAMNNSHISIQLLTFDKGYLYSCTIVHIAQGRPKNDNSLRSKQNETDFCLNDKHCKILLDFRHSCSEKIPYFNCSSIDRLIVCTKHRYNQATFTWKQFYDDGLYIGNTPEIKATITKFIFNVEYFDNNTFVKVLPGNSISNKIIVDPDVIPDDKNISKLTFTDSTDIEFDCEIYLQQTKYVYVGLINTTENKITTLNTALMNNKYGEKYNGSILCCLYYTKFELPPEKYVQRYVKNKTLLLYSTEELADSGITTDLTVLYASVTAAVLILAVAITIVVIKRCCNKTPSSSEPKPAPRKRWEPFYVNKLLQLRKECDREIEAERQAQEPVYEEIS
ncbi:uncharacterized protein LOC110383588 isoform X2 [Helicoverpa armigera]|uniref:uncharacterized protein LOC110383588 isoform X2 n=1 Tax=Helicoverpa armigera TaxID=29058 RepID=UPI0030829551